MTPFVFVFVCVCDCWNFGFILCFNLADDVIQSDMDISATDIKVLEVYSSNSSDVVKTNKQCVTMYRTTTSYYKYTIL